MIGRYLQAAPHLPARPQPARRLIETYDAALARIAADPRFWLTHPRPYPELARYGFRWIKLHRYWFAWHPGPPPVITNISIRTVMRQNLLLALGYNALMVPLAVAGFVMPWLAAAAMSSSSLLVLANSFRLRRGAV